MRVAVLASGSGTNLQAILDHQASLGGSGSAQVVLVASDRADAGALARARSAEITAIALDRESRANGLLAILGAHRVELVVLAGYMRLVPEDVVTHFRGRMLNVHPALLPAFGGTGMYGQRVHAAVIAHGARVSGPTVHFVDARYDEGPIIAQWPVAVLPDDTADTLAARVLEAEHMLYPLVVEAVAAGRVRLGDDGRVVLPGDAGPAHFGPSPDLRQAWSRQRDWLTGLP